MKDKEEGERDEEEEEERDGNTSTGQQQNLAESSDLEPGELATSSLHSMPTSGEGNGDVREGALDCGQSQRDCGGGGSDVCQTGDPGEARQCFWDTLTVHSAAAQTLEFARPFVEDIHWQYCSVNMVSGFVHLWDIALLVSLVALHSNCCLTGLGGRGNASPCELTSFLPLPSFLRLPLPSPPSSSFLSPPLPSSCSLFLNLLPTLSFSPIIPDSCLCSTSPWWYTISSQVARHQMIAEELPRTSW